MRKDVKASDIALFFIPLVVLFSLSVYLIAHVIITTHNPVGAMLTVIGIDITVVGMVLAYFGNLEIDEHSVLWENERLRSSQTIPQCISYPFHLEKPSVIDGDVSGTKGAYEFFLTEFFGTSEEMVEMSARLETALVVRPKTYQKGEGQEKRIIGPISLPLGNYALRFGKHIGEIEASFSLKKTVRRKPHENLYEFGLTLLNVGVPVLITGTISLAFGTFVS